MASKKEFTHRGTVRQPTLGWSWNETLRDGGTYWISSMPCVSTGRTAKYRKTDGKCIGKDQLLDLETIKESK